MNLPNAEAVPPPPDGTVTMVFTDIVGSSALSERHGAAFEPARAMHFAVLRENLAAHGGYEVGTAGDALFAVFADAGGAVAWSIGAHRALFTHSWDETIGRVSVRIGIHTGEPYRAIEAGGRFNYYGPAVNRAARVSSAAHGDQIIVSESAQVLLRPALDALNAGLRDLGTHRLKGVGEERLYQVTADGLPDTFPPPATLSPERHNLPLTDGAFLGRETELSELSALLLSPQGSRLVTLTGFGGMGKTSTARQVAEICAADAEAFPGGVWWAELDEARDADAFLRGIAEAVRAPVQGKEKSGVAAQVTDFLRGRPRFLLVLDNLEQVTDAAAPVVRDLLASVPGLVCLATSRRALGLKTETVKNIRPLASGDAETLFAERARSVRSDFVLGADNAADIAALCRKLEFVPLAIELAAARASAMTPKQILARLEEPFRLLQSRAPDLPARQRAIYATVDWSYDLLKPEEQEVFAALSAFSGAFSLEDAEAVCADAWAAFDSVLLLAEHSLLLSSPNPRSGDMRYQMLETLRTYAAGKLAENPSAQVLAWGRHAVRFADCAEGELAKLRTADEPHALANLLEMVPELVTARKRAVVLPSGGGAELAARLALAQGTSLHQRGFYAEAVAPLDDGIAVARTHPVKKLLFLRLLLKRAGLFCDYDDASSARTLAMEALAVAQTLGDPTEVANAKKMIANAALTGKSYKEAYGLFSELQAFYEAAGQSHEAARMRNNLGLIGFEDPDADRADAVEHLKIALAAYRHVGDTRGVSKALNNLGNLAFLESDYAHAEQAYRESLEINIALGDAHHIAVQLNNLGEVTEMHRQIEAATRLYVAAESVFLTLRHATADYTANRLANLVTSGLVADDTIIALRAEIVGKSAAQVAVWATE